jgi:hypothetical protein
VRECFQEAADAARKANSSETWQEVRRSLPLVGGALVCIDVMRGADKGACMHAQHNRLWDRESVGCASCALSHHRDTILCSQSAVL